MANPDILITPGQGTIGFSGTNTGTIQLRVAESGDIHFEGDQGSLLSLSDDLSDSLFSVNDAAGMPVFEVFADDTIKAYRNNEAKLEIDPDNNRVRLRDNVFVSGNLTVSGDITSASATHEATSYTASTHVSGISGYFGKMGIGYSDNFHPDARLVVGQNPTNGFAIIAGSDNVGVAPQISNSQTKVVRIGMPHYTITEEPATLMTATSSSSKTDIHIGGGTSYGNSIENMYLRTAANHTTTKGTTALYINNNQEVVVGSLGGLTTAAGLGAALTVSGDASITGELRAVDAIFGGASQTRLKVYNDGTYAGIQTDGGGLHESIYFGDSKTFIKGGEKEGIRITSSELAVGHQKEDLNFCVAGTAGQDNMIFVDAGNNLVGFGTSSPSPSYTVTVSGGLAADYKSFIIDHPDPAKPGKQLAYASSETPEHNVFVRGKAQSKIIELPDHWPYLVHEDSISVQLTPIGEHQELYVESIKDNKILINNNKENKINCFYLVHAERKDIGKLEIEPDKSVNKDGENGE